MVNNLEKWICKKSINLAFYGRKMLASSFFSINPSCVVVLIDMLKHSVWPPEHWFQLKYLEFHFNLQRFNVGRAYYCQLIYGLKSASQIFCMPIPVAMS